VILYQGDIVNIRYFPAVNLLINPARHIAKDCLCIIIRLQLYFLIISCRITMPGIL